MKKILVVDDMKGWREFHLEALGLIFGEENLQVETANSARSAYDIIYNNLDEPYDLIITDLQMELDFEPEHAGQWLVYQVQKLKQYKNAKIIIISGAYNIRSIAQKLGVASLAKSNIVKDLTVYKLALDELLLV